MAANRSIVLILAIITQFADASRLPRLSREDSNVLLHWGGLTKQEIQEPVISESCKKIGICKEIDNYPTEFATTLLNELKSMRNLTKFNVDKPHETQYSKDLGEQQDLCESRHEILFPQAAEDRMGKWYFILNVAGRPFQGYQIHQCLGDASHSHSSVAYVKNSSDDDYDYQLECQQQFSIRKMIYMDLENKIVAMDYFIVPSCCSCKLSPILDEI